MSLLKQPKPSIGRLLTDWKAAWQPALNLWSRFTRLKEPTWCLSKVDEKKAGLTGSFAMIRLTDHSVVISLAQINTLGLADFAREILAHEIGHHMYAPADLTDNARLLTRTRAGLPSRENLAGFVSNLYTDLLINNRLQRSAELDLAGVYKLITPKTADALWLMYMRIYELLWKLPCGTLAKGALDAKIGGDAQLGARLIRVYAKDWLDGAGRFAALCLPYLLKDNGKSSQAALAPLLDAREAGAGGEIPEGLAEVDPEEKKGAIHPSQDPNLGGLDEDEEEKKDGEGDQGSKSRPQTGGRAIKGGAKNDYRSPREYTELMKSIGVKVDEQELVCRYYRERALPYLIRFPERILPKASDPLPEGEEVWDIGSPPDEIDWVQSASRSPYIIPGFTTMRRVYGTTPGNDPEKRPPDLYLGIDCSGSMPNPRYQLSFPVLAGTIMALSALRAGARVKAVLSGEPGEFSATQKFTRDEGEVMTILTGYLGTGYAFGIPRLKADFLDAPPAVESAHILIITDNDIFYMLDQTPGGWEIAQKARNIAGAGTYVLHQVAQTAPGVERMRTDGWKVYSLQQWESLIEFARKFSRQTYEKKGGSYAKSAHDP